MLCRGGSHRDVDPFYHRPVIGSKRRRRGVEVLSLDATTQQSGAFFGEGERERDGGRQRGGESSSSRRRKKRGKKKKKKS